MNPKNTEEKSKNKLIQIICPQCKTIPKISTKGTPPKEVIIICPCGEKTKLISDYLIELTKNPAIEPEQQANINFIFCENCQMHIQAPKPGKEHENHKVVYLSQLVTGPKIAQTRQAVFSPHSGPPPALPCGAL